VTRRHKVVLQNLVNERLFSLSFDVNQKARHVRP
jgi:hypothetical protein